MFIYFVRLSNTPLCASANEVTVMAWRCSPNVICEMHNNNRKKIPLKSFLCNNEFPKMSHQTLAGVDFFARTPRTEMECSHEGGTCEFFVLCWMTGGLLQGTCNSVLQGCCHRTAKSSNLGPEAGKTFDLTDLPSTDYGPVLNDPSECT